MCAFFCGFVCVCVFSLSGYVNDLAIGHLLIFYACFPPPMRDFPSPDCDTRVAPLVGRAESECMCCATTCDETTAEFLGTPLPPGEEMWT